MQEFNKIVFLLTIGSAQEENVSKRSLVGSAPVDSFQNTSELKVMIYNEAMAMSEKGKWDKSAIKEHATFQKYKVQQPVKKSQVPEGAKILTSISAMKPKANGGKHVRLNTCGFEQEEGMHYESHNLSAPVVYDMTIRIICVLLIVVGWTNLLRLSSSGETGKEDFSSCGSPWLITAYVRALKT
eukprot:10108470-Ditylum_brightwellii.AAC.1